jgi:phosphohistidine phosphatase
MVARRTPQNPGYNTKKTPISGQRSGQTTNNCDIMQLLVIRHAIAMDRDEFAESGEPDERRPLTKAGTKRMRKAARGLREIVGKVDHVATSPYVRAIETAEIVSDAFRTDAAELCGSLVPDVHFDEFEEWARSHADKSVLAIVGHEPHLSGLVMWLMTGHGSSRIALKKGGACMLDFDSEIRSNSGTLLWLLTPRQLRDVAARSTL